MTKILELIDFDKKFAPKNLVIGTDEAGRGPGAGGVYAAAVYFEKFDKNLTNTLSKLNDSKKLNAKTRKELSLEIKEHAIYSIKFAEVTKIEKINILQASLDSMKRACDDVLSQLETAQEPFILVDGKILIPKFNYKQSYVIKGDGKSASIAAASILAKVERDEYMCELAQKFPQYGWQKNKGYLTREHIEAIQKYGVTEHHRKSFLKNILNTDNQPEQKRLVL